MYMPIRNFIRSCVHTKEEFADQFENKLKELILPEEKQKISNLIARQSVAGGHIHLEYRIKRKDGVVRFCR